MGQYYHPINTDNKQWLYAHKYDNNGLKLMEHSYIGNVFVGAVMFSMLPGNTWDKGHIVWAGDYYGPEMIKDPNNPAKYIPDPDNDNGEVCYYDMCIDKNEIHPPSMTQAMQDKAILVNHTTKQYLKYSNVKSKCNWGWKINPLPLLTCLGNQRGGGDYYGINEDYVGIWANHSLSIVLDIKDVPKDYSLFHIEFKEDR